MATTRPHIRAWWPLKTSFLKTMSNKVWADKAKKKPVQAQALTVYITSLISPSSFCCFCCLTSSGDRPTKLSHAKLSTLESFNGHMSNSENEHRRLEVTRYVCCKHKSPSRRLQSQKLSSAWAKMHDGETLSSCCLTALCNMVWKLYSAFGKCFYPKRLYLFIENWTQDLLPLRLQEHVHLHKRHIHQHY